jgi:hypothetical protein
MDTREASLLRAWQAIGPEARAKVREACESACLALDAVRDAGDCHSALFEELSSFAVLAELADVLEAGDA